MTVGRRTALAVATVCAAGFVLRVIGLHYGLPAVYNPDEVAIMTRALSFGRGTLNPHNFLYPTFYFYVLFAWVGAYLGLLWLTGRVASVAALQRLLFTDPTSIYTAGRALGAVIGTVTVAFVWEHSWRTAAPRSRRRSSLPSRRSTSATRTTSSTTCRRRWRS
jgi:hypothetical protein